MIHDLADAFEALDNETECRALMLCSDGKSFCAGANFANRDAQSGEAPARTGENPLYVEGVRLFRCKKPVVAAIQGPAIGGGLGLALVADFRVATADARFAANFVKIGIHPGFGLTYTLPRLIGVQKASLMFLTGRRIEGKEALAWGLCDRSQSLTIFAMPRSPSRRKSPKAHRSLSYRRERRCARASPTPSKRKPITSSRNSPGYSKPKIIAKA